MCWKAACANAGNRVRVTAQLIEATTGGHVWAERYDRDLADIFAVQDEITNERFRRHSACAGAQRARARCTQACRQPGCLGKLSSRDVAFRQGRGRRRTRRPASFFQRSIELDRQFARAVAALALTYLNEITLFRPHLRPVNLPLALEHSVRAVTIDATDATGHAALARALWMSGRHAESLATAEIAVSLDPNSAAAHGALGGARLWGGFPRESDRAAADGDAAEPVRSADAAVAALHGAGALLERRLRGGHRRRPPAPPIVSRFPSALQHADRRTRAGRPGRRCACGDGRCAGAVRRCASALSCRCHSTNSANCVRRTASI